jgi:hypothetical protein
MNNEHRWMLGNVVVDQPVEHERHIVLRDGRHLVFGSDGEHNPACDCEQRAAQHHAHPTGGESTVSGASTEPAPLPSNQVIPPASGLRKSVRR